MYDGSEQLTFKDKELGSSVLDFWSWAYSDLIRNVNRGAFAEFIVLEAMNNQSGITPPRTDFRVSMDAYDLLSPDGIRVEVKSSAYIQAWESEHPARISFRIAPAKSLDTSGNYSVDSQYCRHSDVYVFCVWTAMSREQNILDLSLWDFYVIATKTLDQKVPNQKTITFQSLLSLQPRKVDYFGLYEAIRSEAMND
jgi:hypothetical protein